MNNKKVFSFHMFLQTLKQTRLAGFIMMAVITLISVVPIISSLSYIKEYKQVNNVGGISGNYFLVLVFIIVVPVISLIVWSFLNKRSSSDFYHSIPYTRLCIYLSKTAAIITWIAGILVVSYVSQAVLFMANRQYFNVDYATMFRMYLSIFICSLLCMAIINVSISITGNILSNICVTGLIMFLPRFIALMVTELTVFHGEAYMISNSGVGLLDSSNNMIVGWVFSVFDMYNGSTGIADMVLSLTSNLYTLVLALIYIALGALLFVKRKSETAGKAANGKVLPMIIRTLIGFSIAFIGVMIAYTSFDNDETIAVVVLFIVSALVVFVYECIVSKKMNVIKQCIPSILLGYVLAVVIGTGANSFGKYEASYEPDSSKLAYVTIQPMDMYYASDNGYFSSISSKVQFTDEEILKYVSGKFGAYKDKCTSNGVHNYIYNGRGSVTNYKVGFRQNGVTHYRRIQLTDSDASKLASLLKKDENFVKAYMDLPDSDKISVDYITGNMEDSDCKDIYETITSEIKQIGFEKWYQTVTSDIDTFLMSVRFSKKGVTYDMVLPISKNMPQSYNKYIGIRNEYAIRNNEKELGTMSDILKQYLNDSSRTWDKYTNGYETLSAVLVYNDTRTYINLDLYVRKDEERAQKVLNGLIESLDKKNFNKNINADNPCIVLNYEKYNPDNGETVRADAVIQLDGYTRTEDYISDIDYY